MQIVIRGNKNVHSTVSLHRLSSRIGVKILVLVLYLQLSNLIGLQLSADVVNISQYRQALFVNRISMPDPSSMRKIGYTQAFKAITVGLLIAYSIMATMAGPLWLFQFHYAPTVIFSAIVTYLAGYFFGGLTGIWILKHKRSAIFTGIIGGFLIMWTGTFIGSLVGLVNEGLPNQNEISEPFYDYIYKPIGLVTMFGFLPIILVGIWFGLSIKKHGDKLADTKISTN